MEEEKALPEYTQDDFLNSTKPYEDVYQWHEDPFQHAIKLEQMTKAAKEIAQIANFKALYSKYTESLKKNATEIYVLNSTNFQGQPVELEAGEWHADDCGVFRGGENKGREMACPHPITLVERITNIDTGLEKIRVAFSKGRRWRDFIVDRNTLASPREIVKLANNGITVNGRTAPFLSDYFMDLETFNYDRIPEKHSVSRLGWIDGEDGFSPYVDDLIFDGEAAYREMFQAVQPEGSFEEWVAAARALRKESVAARIVLAAGFASVLVKPLGVSPFFVHLWGVDSSTGKTVAVMAAASIWANPVMGKYVKTFDGTDVGYERTAEFLNSLPMCIDELQLARNNRGQVIFNVYRLAQGAGRSRGNKAGGVDRTPTWANAIITTGETPLTSVSSGAGAINRVIEIECTAKEKVVQDGRTILAPFRHHYGHAGRFFVDLLQQDGNLMKAELLYNDAFQTLNNGETTDKQAIAAAMIVAADQLATEWIFKDRRAINTEEIGKFLATQAAVSTGQRGYRYLCDWVTQNANKLRPDVEQGDVYGLLDGDWVYIINSVFRRVAEEAGFSASALLSWLKSNELIQTRGRNNTRGKRINGVNTECVVMRLDIMEDEEETGELQEIVEEFL